MFGNVVLRERTEFFITRNYWKEKNGLHAEGQDKRAAISCFKKLRSCKGIFYVALSLDCQHTCPVCLVRTNVTLELFLFLWKFVANCLSWNKCMFFLVWMMRVSHKHFIDKFVNEWEHINWLKKFDIGTTLMWRFRWIDGGTCLNEQL